MEIQTMLQALQSPLTAADKDRLTAQVESYIRFLLDHDFERLVQLLYTIDIDEQKLKKLLQQQPGQDGAAIICMMIVERQLQKQETRRQFRSDVAEDAEGW